MRYTIEQHAGQVERVTVNENEIDRVIIADTDRGEVIFIPYPARLHKRKRDEVYTRKLRGVVEVELRQ